MSLSLSVSKNENFIENFFGEQIVNVQAVVGANGSGKSNLLDSLILLLSNGTYHGYNWVSAFYNSDSGELWIQNFLYPTGTRSQAESSAKSWKLNLKVERGIRYREEVANRTELSF